MGDCVFCKIVSGEIKADEVYRDDEVMAFRDIQPVAPTHIVIAPTRHIASLTDLADADSALAGKMVTLAKQLAVKEGVDATGYRLIINCGKDSKQEVAHLHLHLLGGRPLNHLLG